MITLTGHVELPADRRAAVLAALPDHIAASRAEPGCLSFEVTFDPDHPDRLNVAERFVDRAAFDAHQARTRASAWARVTAGLSRQYQIKEHAP